MTAYASPADIQPTSACAGPALFLTVHADDIEQACGGTRQLHVARGDTVSTLVMCLPDSASALDYSEANIARVVDAIAQGKAAVVYAPWPGEHAANQRTLAWVAREAVRRSNGNCTLAQYELHTPLLAPNRLVDISNELDAKLVRCAPADRGRVQSLNSFRGASLASPAAAAEAFACFTNSELARAPDVAHATPQMDIAQQRPLVSVLVRSTARSTLAQALASIESQTYPNIEVLLINASGGAHAPVVGQRFPIQLLEPGRALSRAEALNPLLEAARGDWLLFLDDDDWLLANHIARLQDALAHNPGKLVAYAGVGCVDADGAPLPLPVYDTPFDRTQLLAGNYIPIHAVLFSRQMMALGCRADTALAMYEDWDFWLQASSHTPFLHVPGVSAIYRQNTADQSGAQQAEKTLAARERVLSKWLPREPVAMPAAIARAMVRDAQALAEYDAQVRTAQKNIETLQQQFEEQDETLQQTRQRLSELKSDNAALGHQVEGHRIHETWLNTALQQSQSETSQRQSEIAQILQSTAWRLTYPLRAIVSRVRSVREAWRRPPANAARQGGFKWRAKQKLVRVMRTVYVALPLPLRAKVWLRDRLFGVWMRLNRGRQRAQSTDAAMDGNTTHNFVRKLYSTGRLQWERADYVPYTDQALTPEDLSLRCIAYYLPQFHPIPENDRWWGKGFTEWTNVTRALPQFIGHYQPKLPGDLGFYDLRVVDTMRKQAELARHYGLAGFCMYYYWFGGHRLLDLPQRQILENPDLDFPFCLCWANENWTRRWDGQEADVLMAQKYSPEDDIAMITDLSPSFADKRYIRIDGKPVFLVYQPTHLPTLRDTVQRWRQHCRENGVGELYLVAVESFKLIDPQEFGFDATCEFPPHQASLPPVNHEVEFINDRFEGRIYDYAHMAEFFTSRPEPKHVRMSGITTAWDNEARKPGKGNIFINTSPENYASWLEIAAARTATSNSGDERVLFVNAWNEWAEGTYLEPDRRFGYAYLHATANVLRQFRKKDLTTESLFESSRATFTKKSDTALVVHLFYRDLLDELCLLIGNAPGDADVFITVADDAPQDWVRELRARLPNAYLMAVPNRGRDILPFFRMLPLVQQFGYANACKLHSKKSPHRDDGQNWRASLWHGLYSRYGIAVANRAFESDKSLGLLAPANSLTDLSVLDIHTNNRPWLDRILQHVEPKRTAGDYKIRFPAGSMFWFRPSAMPLLADLGLTESDFEVELGQVDGTLAHALERLFGFGVKSRGYKVDDISFRKA